MGARKTEKLRVSRQFDEPTRCSTCCIYRSWVWVQERDVTDLRIGRETAATGRVTCRWRLPPLRPVFGTNNRLTPHRAVGRGLPRRRHVRAPRSRADGVSLLPQRQAPRLLGRRARGPTAPNDLRRATQRLICRSPPAPPRLTAPEPGSRRRARPARTRSPRRPRPAAADRGRDAIGRPHPGGDFSVSPAIAQQERRCDGWRQPGIISVTGLTTPASTRRAATTQWTARTPTRRLGENGAGAGEPIGSITATGAPAPAPHRADAGDRRRPPALAAVGQQEPGAAGIASQLAEAVLPSPPSTVAPLADAVFSSPPLTAAS